MRCLLVLAVVLATASGCGDDAHPPSKEPLPAPPARHGGSVLPVDGVRTYVEVTRAPGPHDVRVFVFRGSEPLELDHAPVLSRMRGRQKSVLDLEKGPPHVWTRKAVSVPGKMGTAALRINLDGDLYIVRLPEGL